MEKKPGTKIFIMDKMKKVLPDNEKGEVVIVGDSVSIGYWNNEELTNKVFDTYEINGQKYRLYHTGDKGYKKDGLLFYCGRIDLQIKLHGYRIELEDIENNIMKLPSVRQAAVIPVYKNNSVRSLTAYVVVNDSIEDSFLAAQKIRTNLKMFLPEYMIPKKVVFLNSLPMTVNGKVNRKILEEMN